MRAIKIINILNKWVRPDLIDAWDNTGFQIGLPDKIIKRIIISLDLDREVLDMAIERKAQMIVTHHPIIFRPLKSINGLTYKGRLIYDLIKEEMVVYNAHSNLDLVARGVNDALANALEIKNTEPLNTVIEESLYKLVVFVPKNYGHIIRRILGEAGAGWIGNYSHCTFNIEGVGKFKPLEGTNPFIGETDVVEEVEEVRIETIVKENILDSVVREVIKNHPYEEVAYDVYPLLNKGGIYGYGRIGTIEKVPLTTYLDTIKKSLEVDSLIVYGNLNKNVTKVALCGGSGASFIQDAYEKNADVYITGDIKYHEAQYANELGLTLVDAGHYHTEKIILPVIKEYLDGNTRGKVETEIYNRSSPPYIVY